MAEFTPGPWSVERIDYDKYGLDASFEVKVGRRTIAQTHMREIKRDGQALAADEANCHLIAAAPDMFAALEWIFKNTATNSVHHIVARDALAKATPGATHDQ